MKHIDVAILGQGLSGSLLANELLKRNQSVVVVDANEAQTASKVAIGLVNPITGKRLVKSWMIDDLLPVAKQTYKNLEEEFRTKLIHDTTIARVIPNEEIFQQWAPNFETAVEEGYISPNLEEISFGSISHKYFTIQHCFWLETVTLLREMKTWLQNLNSYLPLRISDSFVEVRSQIYENGFAPTKIVDCRGANAAKIGWFSYLPFNVNKGEVIDVQLNNYSFPHILKKNIFIVPDGQKHRVGSTYDREFTTEKITEAAKQYFKKKLNEMVGLPYEVLQHQAAVRPSTIDRRPFLGKHPNEDSVFIFNGFGAKGVSLIPYFAQQFCDYLLDNQPLLPEVDINRFSSSH